MEILFWISFFIIFYTYLGYGLLLSVLSAATKKIKPFAENFMPPVALIIPAFNEEAFIIEKIENTLSLDYPADKLTLIVITDGSTDNTPKLAAQFPGILHLHLAERKGKTAALNRAMKEVKAPFVIFTDANTVLDTQAIKNIVRHYNDAAVGGVSGEKRIADTGATGVSVGERIYWRYESMLKQADSDFYTVVGAAGELLSFRTNLFEPIPEHIILDDFVLSANICKKGYRVVYEKSSYAIEAGSTNFKEERKRKVRISAGCFQALLVLKHLLNPWRNWRLAFQFLSHRVLRWTACPLLLPVLFLSNLFLALSGMMLYQAIFAFQVLFYLVALAGWLFSNKVQWPKFLFIPYYFVFMNFSLYAGFYRFVSGKQSVIWERSQRGSL